MLCNGREATLSAYHSSAQVKMHGGTFALPGLTMAVGKVKVKVKFTLEQATKTQRGSRSIAVLFL